MRVIHGRDARATLVLPSPAAFSRARGAFVLRRSRCDNATNMPGTLFIVATPIGNLEDLTPRALRVLGEVDLIACEDTRHTRGLLNRFGVQAKTISYHEHNERERAEELGKLLEAGNNIAIVSDAGTPLISDPGFRIVRAAIERGIRVIPIPGPAAFVAALIASGLPTDQFFFAGFLPARATARRALLDSRNAGLLRSAAPDRCGVKGRSEHTRRSNRRRRPRADKTS